MRKYVASLLLVSAALATGLSLQAADPPPAVINAGFDASRSTPDMRVCAVNGTNLA